MFKLLQKEKSYLSELKKLVLPTKVKKPELKEEKEVKDSEE